MTELREVAMAVVDGMGTITLDRPDRLNAYTPDMGDELVACFRALAADPAVGVIVLTGAGRAFCAGADRDFLKGARGRNGMRLGEEYFIDGFAAELLAIEKPVIAAINGPAMGIGATMLLPLDIRIASTEARFGFPFARIGLMPGMGSTCLLARTVGAARAREIFLTGATLDAEAALAAGLVSQVLPPERLIDGAIAIARAVLECDPQAIAACKQALDHDVSGELANAIEREQRAARALAHSRGAESQSPETGA
jgi:2-(1,2-epoxy-1,2-dihydrophenyl)acetyl-CoA isomerase